MAGIQGARYCLLPGRLAGARPYVAGRHCGHLRHRLAVSADVLAGRLRGVHCALRPLYTSNSFVQQGSDWTICGLWREYSMAVKTKDISDRSTTIGLR